MKNLLKIIWKQKEEKKKQLIIIGSAKQLGTQIGLHMGM
jgi:ribosomal protein L7Ae-like RNA K-turn-binding protein